MEEQEKTTQVEDTPLTFDEILGDKTYQAEFDRRLQKSNETAVANALAKAKAEWEAEYKAKQTEAEKLAKMDAEQKAKYELKKIAEERDNAIAKLNAKELKETAIKIAQEKGLDISLLEDIDFSKQTAETITTIIDTKKAVFDKAVEKAMNNNFKEKTPLTVQDDNSASSASVEMPKLNPMFRQ